MNNEKMEISVPVIATRGIIVFPQQDIMIEVGREKSIRAVEEAEEKFDGHVWLVCQKDIMVDNPAPSDLYTFGTLCRIKNIRRKEGFMRITFSGLERAKLVSIQDEDRMFMATVLPVADEAGDNLEEMALIRRVANRVQRQQFPAGDHCSADQGRFRADAVRSVRAVFPAAFGKEAGAAGNVERQRTADDDHPGTGKRKAAVRH